MKKVSVVILNWNGVGMLQKFLPKVVEYSANQGVEICVADNASTDESVSFLKTHFPDVRLIVLDKNYEEIAATLEWTWDEKQGGTIA